MPKNLFQDMVRVKRMRQEESRVSTPVRVANEAKREEKAPPERFVEKLSSKSSRSTSRKMPWIIALCSVIFFLFAFSILFTKAEIMVTPKTEEITLNENYLATKGVNGEAPSFDLIVLSGEEQKTVQGGELKEVAISAKGKVVIYNNFSSSSQRLDINTRLEGSNGKIYKTEKAVTVGGMKGSIPGSVEVGIYGTEAGEEYNSAPLDFKIFGFKGTPKYTKFYGRSIGPIAGGQKGEFPSLSETEKTNILNELQVNLKTQLIKKATDQIPSGFILFNNAVFLNVINHNFGTPGPGSNITATLKGTLYGILFEEKKLTRQIVEDNVAEYDGSEVYIPNIKELNFSISSVTDMLNFENLSKFNFNLSGFPKVVWRIDESKLISDLAGVAKKDFNQILMQHQNVLSAQSKISPFWKRSFPEEEKDIKILISYP